VLLLLLFLGPCVINLLIRFIYNQVNVIKLQLVRQYQRLPLDDFPEMAIRDYDGKEEGMIRKPGERSRMGRRSKSKALPPCWGPCFQLSHSKLWTAFLHSCADLIYFNLEQLTAKSASVLPACLLLLFSV
jgi:hypothetical protein